MNVSPSRRDSLLAWVLPALTIAIVIRVALIPIPNGDTGAFLVPWYDYIVTHGGYHALADPFSNYTPFYTYLLAFMATTFSFIDKLVAIKIIPMLFDFLAAGFAWRIVRLHTPDCRTGWAAFIAILMAPAVIFEGAYWGQADILYTAFLLGFLYFMLRDRPLTAMLCFSIAFSIKLQSIFICPLILGLMLRRKIPWTYSFLPAVAYLVIALPAWIAGRPLLDLLTIYLQQGDYYKSLTMDAPNLYLYISNELYNIVTPVGLAISMLIGLLLALVLWRGRAPLSGGLLLQATTLVLLTMPFVLPKMHERYFFPAAISAIPLAFYRPKLKIVPLIFQVSLLVSFLPFLKGYPNTILSLSALLNLLMIVWLSANTLKELYPHAEWSRRAAIAVTGTGKG